MKKLLLFTLFALASHSPIMQASQPNESSDVSGVLMKAASAGFCVLTGAVVYKAHGSLVAGYNPQDFIDQRCAEITAIAYACALYANYANPEVHKIARNVVVMSIGANGIINAIRGKH